VDTSKSTRSATLALRAALPPNNQNGRANTFNGLSRSRHNADSCSVSVNVSVPSKSTAMTVFVFVRVSNVYQCVSMLVRYVFRL